MTNTQPRHDAPATVPASVSAPQPPLNNPRHFLDKGGIGIGCVPPNLAWSNTKAPTYLVLIPWISSLTFTFGYPGLFCSFLPNSLNQNSSPASPSLEEYSWR